MRDINLGLHGSAGPQKPKETGKVRDSKCSLFFGELLFHWAFFFWTLMGWKLCHHLFTRSKPAWLYFVEHKRRSFGKKYIYCPYNKSQQGQFTFSWTIPLTMASSMYWFKQMDDTWVEIKKRSTNAERIH